MRNMEWKKYELEELMEKSGIVRGPFGGVLKKEIFVDKGYKVYEQKNAINSNYVDGRYYVTKEKYNELSRFKVRKNDFIVSCSGTIGKIYKIPEDAPQGIINQALLKLTINTKILDIDFFEQYFKWESFQDKIMENSQGGAIKNLVRMKTFRKIELLIPSLKEQKKIAEILSTWDDAINKIELLLVQSKYYFDTLFNNILRKKRAFESKGRWCKQFLKDLLEERTEKSSYNNQYPILTSSREGIFLQSEYFKKTVASSNNIGYKIIKKGEFTFRTMSDDGTFKFNRLEKYEEGIVSPAYSVFYANKIEPRFLYLYLNSHQFTKEIIKESQGGTRLSLNYTKLSRMYINIPPYETQLEIANYFHTLDQNIEKLEQLKKSYQVQKQGLMQQLLTGKIRVNSK